MMFVKIRYTGKKTAMLSCQQFTELVYAYRQCLNSFRKHHVALWSDYDSGVKCTGNIAHIQQKILE